MVANKLKIHSLSAVGKLCRYFLTWLVSNCVKPQLKEQARIRCGCLLFGLSIYLLPIKMCKGLQKKSSSHMLHVLRHTCLEFLSVGGVQNQTMTEMSAVLQGASNGLGHGVRWISDVNQL
jgi:hypothetical protein